MRSTFDSDALDLRAERDQEAAEILDVRLARGVADHRLARVEHGGHDRVLGRHHARLVEEDVLAAQTARCAARNGRRCRPPRPARRTHGCADRAGAGRSRRRRGRHARPAEAREQRACEQERGADPARELRGPARAEETSAAWTRTSFWPVHSTSAPSAEISAIIVSTSRIRGTFEHDRLARQEARGEHRQGAVLVPGGAYPAAEGLPALDHEGLGERIA